MDNWSVWVGGIEVNDYALTLDKANQWAEEYLSDGYDDVAITKIDEDWVGYKFRQWEDN